MRENAEQFKVIASVRDRLSAVEQQLAARRSWWRSNNAGSAAAGGAPA